MWGWVTVIWGECKKMQKKCKKMQKNLHISKKSSTFASDLGIVPTTTIKKNRVMKEKCIFRVQTFGRMWRVMESVEQDENGRYKYRIMNKRRVCEKFSRANGRTAIEQCMRYALGCSIEIGWGEIL